MLFPFLTTLQSLELFCVSSVTQKQSPNTSRGIWTHWSRVTRDRFKEYMQFRSLSVMPKKKKRFREKAKGTLIWTDQTILRWGFRVNLNAFMNKMIVYIFLSFCTAGPRWGRKARTESVKSPLCSAHHPSLLSLVSVDLLMRKPEQTFWYTAAVSEWILCSVCSIFTVFFFPSDFFFHG